MYLSGHAISALMSSVYTFAVGLYVLKMTGSGLSFALTLSLQILPTVLIGPLAGVIADRFNKKIMVVLTDTFNAALFITVFAFSRDGLSLSDIYAATLLLSISQALYSTCIGSAVPNIVSKRRIISLNSIEKIIDSAAAIIGPGLGGILYAAVDMRLFILLNGIAFILSTITECLIDFRLYYTPVPQTLKLHLRQDLAEGIHYIEETDWIKRSSLNFLVINFFTSLCYAVPVPYILNNIFHLSSKAYGIVQCFMPVGMIMGALLIKRIADILPYHRLMTAVGSFLSFCLFLFGIFPAAVIHPAPYTVVAYYAVFMACYGVIVSLIDIPFINNLQTKVPENIRGRSLSISLSIIKIFAPVGYILSGSMIGTVPAFYLPLFGGVVLFIVYLITNKRN